MAESIQVSFLLLNVHQRARIDHLEGSRRHLNLFWKTRADNHIRGDGPVPTVRYLTYVVGSLKHYPDHSLLFPFFLFQHGNGHDIIISLSQEGIRFYPTYIL